MAGDVYTVKEAAARLGVSLSAMYELLSSGRAPGFRTGRSNKMWRISVRAFEEWIEKASRQNCGV